MEKKIATITKKVKNTLGNVKAKVACAVLVVSNTMYCLPVYAANEENAGISTSPDKIVSFTGGTIDTIFNWIALGIALLGAIHAIPAILSLVHGIRARDGAQKDEAGNSATGAIMELAVAAGVFAFKALVKNLLGLSS